jgi:hypothetical protein
VADGVPSPTAFGPLAQLVEQETLNLLVVGSIPTRPTISVPYSANVVSPSRRLFCKRIVSSAPGIESDRA